MEERIYFIRYLCCIVILSGILSNLSIARSEELLPTISTRKDLDAFIQSYYLEPKPDLITQAIDVMDSEKVLSSDAQFLYLGFFLQVYAINPKFRAGWEALLEIKSEPTRSALLHEVDVYKKNPQGGLDIQDPSEQRNDMEWGAFFASGNGRFINILINDMMHVDERIDKALFLTGASAKLSLAKNALLHPEVSIFLKNERNASQGRKKQLISDVLTLSPDKIRDETEAILTKQKENGIWLKP
jgi:hypothetical protein